MLTLMYLTSRAFSRFNGMLGNELMKLPRPLVICGPSGSGKSTLLKKLFQEFPHTFGFSVSHTTRKPRPNEVNGVDYHFVTEEEMKKAIANGEFIEYAIFCGNYYGTSQEAVEKVQQNGKVCILDIDSQGVEQILRMNFNPILIFNKPPSIEELERRIRMRNTETEETLKKRLEMAQKEMLYGATPGKFGKVILNDDINVAYGEFRQYILSQLKEQESQGIKIRWN